MNQELPRSGPLPRPKSVREAAESLRREVISIPTGLEVIFEADGFISNCPRTGQPDFGRVRIRYISNGLGLEGRALQFYLWSFRDEGAFCETLADRILKHVKEAIHPRFVEVVVCQNTWGGIRLIATARWPNRGDYIQGEPNCLGAIVAQQLD